MSIPKKKPDEGNEGDRFSKVGLSIVQYVVSTFVSHSASSHLFLLLFAGAGKLTLDYELPEFRLLTKLQQFETKSVDEFSGCGELAKKFLTTLPRTFNNLVGTLIDVQSEKPRQLIELLGNVLGITDYAENKPAFWFLDTLALQVVRRKHDLDDHYMGVLVSWLAGEIRLLRDRKYTREEFFKETKDIFTVAAVKVSEQKLLPYWEEIVFDYNAEAEAENRVSVGDLSTKSLQNSSSQENDKSSPDIDPLSVLDIIIKATYDMYGNELRYALVYAVFVEPIEVQMYNLPFTFRTPRPVRIADSRMVPFIVQLQRMLRKGETLEKSKKSGKKATGKKGKGNSEVPPTPPPSLGDERMLISKRLFILPLIEANEAVEMFETNSSDT